MGKKLERKNIFNIRNLILMIWKKKSRVYQEFSLDYNREIFFLASSTIKYDENNNNTNKNR